MPAQSLCDIQRAHPETLFVSICDREGDFFDLLEKAAKPNGAHLLVRAERTRHKKVHGGDSDQMAPLWETMGRQPCAGVVQHALSKQTDRKARTADLEVRFGPVTLHPPTQHASTLPVSYWAVFLKEINAPEGETPIEWMLLTTVPTNTLEAACTRAKWYASRWGIEVFHRTLKTGCGIEDRQLGTASRLETCLAIDMVVAWRIFFMSWVARQNPDAPCTVFFTEAEWKSLCAVEYQRPDPPPITPPLAHVMGWLAKAGGHLGRKCDGFPGAETLWRGLQKLDYGVRMWLVYHPEVKEPPVWREYPNAYQIVWRPSG